MALKVFIPFSTFWFGLIEFLFSVRKKKHIIGKDYQRKTNLSIL